MKSLVEKKTQSGFLHRPRPKDSLNSYKVESETALGKGRMIHEVARITAQWSLYAWQRAVDIQPG